MDASNGYEAVATEFIAARERPDASIGAATARAWARTLPAGAAVLDLGCGSGVPISKVLAEEGLRVFAIDGSPTLTAAFRERCPSAPVACEGVEESPFFARRFDGIIAWGLVFLLPAATQLKVLEKAAAALVTGGRLLFTSPAAACSWDDVLTHRRSVSLGATTYRQRLAALGLSVTGEYDDEGENHYYDAVKLGASGATAPAAI